MEAADRMSLVEIEGPHFAGISRSLSPIQTLKVSADQLNDYWSHSHSSDSGVGQDYSGRAAVMQPPQRSSMGCKLQVKHVTQLGTQCGLLVPKYHVHNHSKCIMCKDCGIFFSYDAFLGHSHDKHGRKRHRPQAPALELDEEHPNTEQIGMWQEFIFKIGQTAGSKSVVDGDNRKSSHADYHRVKVRETNPSSNEENIHSGGTFLSDFDKNIQESVSASERLLRETSQYLHSSTEKLRHRRQKSLRNHQLLPKTLLQDDPLSTSASKHVQPVIKDLHSGPSSRRANRKFLEKYLEKSRDSFQLLTDSMTMSSKTDSLRVGEDSVLHPELDPIRDSSSGVGVEREIHLGGGGDAVQKATSPRPVSPGKTPQGKSKMLQEHFNRNDPLFIVQTAQELLNLAALKMQEKEQNSPGGIDWQKKYEAERELRKEQDKRIRELEGLYQEEMKRRQNAEVQLRAMRLQNL
ncbi:uncharacterized protein [Asterias amurensis]|uniref:uncharacterized protein n=1 Tax=Asterias amurensis TaxID=7602 RepID=UPI003AB42C68